VVRRRKNSAFPISEALETELAELAVAGWTASIGILSPPFGAKELQAK
jgi:hypothetical protein